MLALIIINIIVDVMHEYARVYLSLSHQEGPIRPCLIDLVHSTEHLLQVLLSVVLGVNVNAYMHCCMI